MQPDTINHIQIELHVPDFKTVLSFYGKLGFKKLWQSADYLVLERSGTILSFWPGNAHDTHAYFDQFPKDSKRGLGVEIVIPVDNAQEFYDQICDLVTVVTPLKKRPWGATDFRIEDPFGYYLRITDRHDITDTKHKV